MKLKARMGAAVSVVKAVIGKPTIPAYYTPRYVVAHKTVFSI
jgi:hypothetical protein